MDDRKYPTPEKFAADVRLVWKNAMTYNRPDSDIYITADKLSKLFERKFAQIKKPGNTSDAPSKRSALDVVFPLCWSRQCCLMICDVMIPFCALACWSGACRGSEKKSDGQLCRDRRKFAQLVNQLSSDELEQLVGMIQRNCPQALDEVGNVGCLCCVYLALGCPAVSRGVRSGTIHA